MENNRTLPYGESWLPEVSSANDKKFTTYIRDNESNLDYAKNRFYGNSNGRFTSADKGEPRLFAPLTLNRYLYAAADPVNYTDPDGNEISVVLPLPRTPGGGLFEYEGGMNPEHVLWAGLGEAPYRVSVIEALAIMRTCWIS